MSRRWTRRGVLGAAGSALLAGCNTRSNDTGSGTPTGSPGAGGGGNNGSGGNGDGNDTGSVPSLTPVEWEAPTDAPTTEVTTNVLVENLEVPWDISVAPNGDLFVTERVGRVNRFESGDVERVLAPEDAIDAGATTPGYESAPWWVQGGEGGTLGVAVHPRYPDVSDLFVYYTAETGSGKVNRVSRFDVSAGDPNGTERVLIDGIPASNIHNGGRITFGPDGYLWVTTGEAGEADIARDPSTLGGKVLRVTDGGEPAPDNPDIADGDPRVYTYGHRNPQGIVWTPDLTPVVNEHGPEGHDEINRLVAGGDYGWPDARRQEEYASADGIHPPLANTGGTTWAPTGSLFYTGRTVESWRNRMVIGGLVSQQIVVATLSPPGSGLPPATDAGRRFDAGWYDDAYTVTATPVLGDELGRVRHVEQGLDGELYAITSNRDGRARPPFPREFDDVLVEIVPA